ncbi:MAG TPA: hypothetical protein VHB20_10345 [Verrucomicrobiae bacterium]|jgi:hypothetical protein|nr:hypothetical protein [Verrucomicrobiae bacterium]
MRIFTAAILLLQLTLRLSAGVTTLASFPAGSGGWQMGTIAVGNLDSDPQLEIVVPYRDPDGQWHLDAFKWNGTHIAGFPHNTGYEVMNTSPTLYDLDGDGKMEIIFTQGDKLVALRGDGSLYWSNAVTYQNYVPQGGFQTVTNGFYLTTDNQFHARLPSDAQFFSEVSSPFVADFDGTGKLQVATAWKIDPDPNGDNQDYNPFISPIFGFGEWGTVGESWSGGVVFHDAHTGAQNFVYHIHQLVETGIGVGRPDPAGNLNVYVLNDSDSVVAFDKTKPFGFYGNGQLHGMFGKNNRMTTGFYQQGIDTYAADIDGDGRDELLSVTTQFNCLYEPHESILDDDGALMWRQWKDAVEVVNNNGWFNNAGMIPVNPEHTNRLSTLSFTHGYEIYFRQWNGVNMVDRPGWPKNFAPYLPTPPVVGDVDGNGQQEIIIGTYDPAAVPSNGSLYVYALDGTLKAAVPVPGGLKHIPFLADVNHDGSLDVVYRSLAGQVYVQNFGATTATNVSWATHRGNAQRNGFLGQSLYPPNTPLITQKTSGTRKASFAWGGAVTNVATEYRIYRASDQGAPLQFIAKVPAQVHFYTDFGLAPGWQYIYEVAAVVNGQEIHSAPFAVLSLLNNNLVANPGFEENDNSHWDKWDTGDISWDNMVGSGNAFQGRQAMQIVLQNNFTTDTINQYAQYGTPRSYIPVTPGTLYSFGGYIKGEGLLAPTSQWFEWTSSLTGEDYASRPTFPYPDYFTPVLNLGLGSSSWTYLNRVFTLPAGFPNVELRHRFSTLLPANGSVYLDNMFFRALPPGNSALWNNLVSFGSTWRYFTSLPPVNWYAANFNDATWPQAPAKFGCGSSPTNVVTAVPPGQPAYYFRRTFNVTQTNLEEFLLAATCTDDYGGTIYPLRLWLNGQEVVSSGIEAVSFEGNDVKYFDLTPFQGLLKSGVNTVAVQVNNVWDPDWDNVAFDVSLKAVFAAGGAARIVAVQRGASVVNLEISALPGSSVRVESQDRLGDPWQVVQTLANVTTNTVWATDSGQNGRSAPSSVGNRFYRVISY